MKRIIFLTLLFIIGVFPAFAEDDINNHLVDLALPSGTLWLDHNLGAVNSVDFGYYYLGGEWSFVESSLGSYFSVPTKKQFQELIENTNQRWGEKQGVKGMIFTASNGNSIFLPAAAHLWYNREGGKGFWDINNEGSGAYWTSTPSNYEGYIYFLEFSRAESEPFFGDRDATDNRLPIRPVYYKPFSCVVFSSFESRYVGESVKGFSADGISELKITYDSPNVKLDNNVELIFKGAETSLTENECGTVKDIKYSDNSIEIILQAPDNYAFEGSSTEVQMYLTTFSDGKRLNTEQFNYYITRPGVLLFHGLNDRASLFEEMKKHLENSGSYESIQLLPVDYSSSNTSSFEINTHVNHIVRKGCRALQEKLFKESGIISSRFDMVGHSMGGILIRLFVQEDDGYDATNKIITLNTPHFGSELGNIAVWADYKDTELRSKQDLNQSEQNFSWLYKFLLENFGKTDDSLDAIGDLAIASDAIENLNGSSSYILMGIPVHAVCSEILKSVNPKFPVYPSAFIVPQLLWGIATDKYYFLGDGVVPTFSQRGGLNDDYVSVYSGGISNAFHTNSPKWERFINRVYALLTSPKDSNVFSLHGFNGLPSKTMMKNMRQAELSEYVVAFNPIDSTKTSFQLTAEILSAEEKKLNLKITQSEDINYSFVFGFTENGAVLYDINSTNTNFNLSNYDFNEITFYAVGKTDYNAIVVDSISVDSQLNISSIDAIPDVKDDFEIISLDNSIIIKSMIEHGTCRFSLVDVSGQIIREGYMKDSVTIHGLSTGLYILSIADKTYKIAVR